MDNTFLQVTSLNKMLFVGVGVMLCSYTNMQAYKTQQSQSSKKYCNLHHQLIMTPQFSRLNSWSSFNRRIKGIKTTCIQFAK